MPTAAEFNGAAKILEDLLLDFDEVWKTLDGVALDTGLGGESPAQVQVVNKLDTAMSDVANAKTAISATASELRGRAAICEQYVADLNDYRRNRMEYLTHPDLVAKPVRPTKPFSWVEG